MDIRNENVKEIYSRWRVMWEDTDLEEGARIRSFSIMKNIELLVNIYENKEELDDGEIDDLFIDWETSGINPVFSEERDGMVRNIKKTLTGYSEED